MNFAGTVAVAVVVKAGWKVGGAEVAKIAAKVE